MPDRRTVIPLKPLVRLGFGSCSPKPLFLPMRRTGLKKIENRESVVSRDRSCCRKCGRKISQGHVHHIFGRVRTPRWMNVPNDDPNHIANLIFLCVQCHFEVHNPLPTREAQEALKRWKEVEARKNLRKEGIEVIE